MKETVNVNIGSQAFTLDEDAYRVLRSYLDDIRSRLPEYDTETMGDIEVRIAEIFREIVSSPMRVITLDTVRAAMHQMGAPSDFGERRGNAAPQEEEDAEPETRKLYRSRTDRSIAGICGGLAAYFGADPTMIRLLTLLLILFGGLSKAGKLLFEPTQWFMEENMLFVFKNKVKLLPSGIQGKNAAILGASALIWQEAAK